MAGNVGWGGSSGENISGESSGECNSSWVKKILNISELFMLVELLLGSTKVHWKLGKALRTLVQRRKQNCFALLQGGEGPRPVSVALKDGCQNLAAGY